MLQPLPPGYQKHIHYFEFEIAASEAAVWEWLNDTRTFTDTQVWPYKVEFYSPDENTPNGFYEGVLTTHTGPFVNFPGELVKIDEKYRDLQYYYGSYAIHPHWVRPFRLEFWTYSIESGTQIKCALSSYVKPWIFKFWAWSQRLFWGRFQRWSTRQILKIEKGAKRKLQSAS
ncbi:MAG: hypothetical protein R8G66_01850 [Cytophagales bacterium]|nr:hypothetical protein [Cytophagales bacterium]